MPTYKTCDVCRKRKIKCLPINGSISESTGDRDNPIPCTSCDRLGLECTYNHIYGKPGRRCGSSVLLQHGEQRHPSSSTKRPRSTHSRSQTRSGSSAPVTNAFPRLDDSALSFDTPRIAQHTVTNYDSLSSWISPTSDLGNSFGPGSPLSRILNSMPVPSIGTQGPSAALNAGPSSNLYTPVPNSPLLPDLSAFILPSPTDGARDNLPEHNAEPLTNLLPHNQKHDREPDHPAINSQIRLDISPSHHLTHPEGDAQIEDIVSWNTVSFFIRLYLGYLHPLAPIVHRPSFSQDLAMRRDRSDKDFRALCLGIAAYAIGQSPLGRMQDTYSRSDLEAFQHKFHRASIALLDRSYRSPSIVHVGTLLTGYFYCRSVGKSNRAAVMLAEACQLVRLMRLHDDDHVSTLGLDCIDVQLYRRVFWHAYAVDITEASSGLMIHLNSFEGLPQLPAEIDDELITTAGMFEQPQGKQSYMSGFVQSIRLFPILEECLVRRRRWSWHGGAGVHPDRRDAGAGSKATEAERRWIDDADSTVNDIMGGLPEVLREGQAAPDQIDGLKDNQLLASVLGMQRANLTITAVSVRFALYEYSACLGPDSSAGDGEDRRATLGRQAHRALSAMPFDDLAANGESIRGKISRILMALLGSDKESVDWLAVLQDWWNMFIQIQSVQLVAANADSRLPSPVLSPHQNPIA